MTPAGPSPHLYWIELACKDGTPYPMIWRSTRALILAKEFEAFRHLCGDRPLEVLSAFRTPEWNRRVGGASNSQHVHGRALDILKPTNFTLEQFWNMAHAYAMTSDSGLYGLGRYPWGVHLDIRPANRLAVWNGSRPEADNG